MKYNDCKYLKKLASMLGSNEYELITPLCNCYTMYIVGHGNSMHWSTELQFYNYLPYLKLYKQRIIDAARNGNTTKVEDFVKKLMDKTFDNAAQAVQDAENMPSGWAKLVEQMYLEVLQFNNEYEEACLEAQIRSM